MGRLPLIALTNLFVYGTLMPGQPLWALLEPFVASWTPATARGVLWDTGRGYPAARFDATPFDATPGGPAPGGAAAGVPGVLVHLAADAADRAIALLDDVEEEGVLYRRVEVETTGGVAEAYAWLGPTDGLVALEDGWAPSPAPRP